MYRILMDEARWGVVFPGISMPVLMLRADCSLFALKPARSSPYLPIPPPNVLSLHKWFCFHLLRLMPLRADKSAVGEVNRPLQLIYNFFIHLSWLLVIEY
jgi:hypothetical protein